MVMIQHQRYTLYRTTSSHPHFRQMVGALDEDLMLRNGETQNLYHQYNKTDNISHAVVVYADDLPVGCGCFKPYNDLTVEMKRMFVLPGMRGRKLAAQLLQELENWALEEDYQKAILETGIRQVEAIRLYTRSGYQLIDNYDQYVGMADSICYQKELK